MIESLLWILMIDLIYSNGSVSGANLKRIGIKEAKVTVID